MNKLNRGNFVDVAGTGQGEPRPREVNRAYDLPADNRARSLASTPVGKTDKVRLGYWSHWRECGNINDMGDAFEQ